MYTDQTPIKSIYTYESELSGGRGCVIALWVVHGSEHVSVSGDISTIQLSKWKSKL